MPSVPPSGEQFEIVHGDQRATIVEVGGGIREYGVAGRDVLDPYPLEAMCDGAHGAPLIPWPNRLADGRYRFDGAELQLALSEPGLHNAIHGLLRWRSWHASDRDGESVRMATRLHASPGYPFTLDVSIDYRLTEDGLRVSTQRPQPRHRAVPLRGRAAPLPLARRRSDRRLPSPARRGHAHQGRRRAQAADGDRGGIGQRL